MRALDSIRQEYRCLRQRTYEHRSLFHRPAYGTSWAKKTPEKDPYCLWTVTAGGDSLVAARHLWHYDYQPTVYYPKQSKNELYQRLTTQLKNLGVPFTEDFGGALKDTSHVVDAIFGFSFSGEVREPFPAVIRALKETTIPVTSIDAPSSWDIENGPPNEGPGQGFYPTALVSLTAPKPLAKFFHGRHFLGGRFVSPDIAQKYDLELPEYDGIDQIVELDPKTGQKLKL
ncbi:unnamed protein product [Tuber melanosporum]|uniref:NAD(P)H-hydrate epimerase n=1 Tax=Tuber melanosporum (strain Mel28) TaxID=656061 RepID=D5G990_TUBMM|nr:uncharacterized protein GSTUM_00003200001 [Tuber melanosporum]CAZ81083.1 unnamed protein product [Tuber melanosporum]